MSRTHKDSKHTKNTVLEVVKRDDGKFNIFLNASLDQTSIPEEWLPEQLCVRFGFCGEEYDSIVRELDLRGRKTLVFG